MTSPKWALLIAAFALVGSGALPMAAAQQAAEVDVERNNEINQEIKQKQEACTNEADVNVSDDDLVDIGGDNEAEVEQENDCLVTQTQNAANVGDIDDFSFNDFGVESILADVGLDL